MQLIVYVLLAALVCWIGAARVRMRLKLAALPPDAPVKYCPRCGKVLEKKMIADRLRFACGSCNWVHWDNPKPVVIILIPSNGGLVLVRRKFEPAAGSWALPGGFIEAGEHPQVAARREAKEETKLDVEIDRLVGVFTPPNGVNEILLFYLSKPVNAAPNAGDDAEAAEAFSQDRLPENIVFKLHKRMIDDWFSGKLN